MARNETTARFTASLIAGLLLVPASAVGAFAIVSNTIAEPTPQTATTVAIAPATTEAPVATTTTVTAPAATEVVVIEPPTASAADLAAACGVDGMILVDGEAAELLDEVQQAALDALRQVCADAGTPLPGPPAPPPEIVTITVADSVASVVGDAVQATYSGEYEDDDHDEYEEHEEDEHEEDEHEEEEDEHEEDDD